MAQKILVVDDSEELRELLRAHFQDLGYEVQVAQDGARVMRLLEEEVPDLIILDVMMPNLNGFQICRKIKSDSRLQKVPVLMLTARSRPEDVYWGKDCGADDYLTKPFRTAELESRVQGLLSDEEDPSEGEREPLRWVQVDKVLQESVQGSPDWILCSLKWDSKAADVFRKKYGEVQFGEVMNRVFEVMRVILAGESLSAGVEFQPANGIRMLLGVERVRAENLARKLAFHLNHLLMSYYSHEDLDRGGVVYRKFQSKKETRVPILAFEPSLKFFNGH